MVLAFVVKIPLTCNDLQLIQMIPAQIYLEAFGCANKIKQNTTTEYIKFQAFRQIFYGRKFQKNV